MSTTVATTTESGATVVGTPADKALLIIRIAAGIVFIFHGAGILFGAFGGPGLHGFSGFTKMPLIIATLVGLAQFCGGLAVLTGFLTRIGAACIIVVMLGAIFMVHLPHGFDVTKGGFEYAFVQFCIALAVLIDGPGVYALSSALPHPVRRL